MRKTTMRVMIGLIVMVAVAMGDTGFGKYNFMASTGAELCKKAPTELKCCSGSWTDENGKVFSGGEWRTGVNAELCQKAMHEAFATNTGGTK